MFSVKGYANRHLQNENQSSIKNLLSELYTEIKSSFKNTQIFTLPKSEGYRATKEKQHRNQRNKKPNLHTRSDRDDGDSCTSHTDSSRKNRHEQWP